MASVRYFSAGIDKAIKMNAKYASNETYGSYFSYFGKYNLGSLFGVPKEDWGMWMWIVSNLIRQ